MSDKKYPYIGQCSIGTVLFSSAGFGAALKGDSKYWDDVVIGEFYDFWVESAFENITREYLTNTCGRVESKEHAEFISKLAEVNGINVAKPKKENLGWFSFWDNKLGFFEYEISASQGGCKQITIPLPPKGSETESACEVNESEMENHKRNEQDLRRLTKFMSKNGLGNIGGSAVDAAIVLLSAVVNESKPDESSGEWPQVGDEVVTIKCKANDEDLIKKGLIGTVLTGEFKGEFCVKLRTGLEVMDRSQFKKPPTPEEELRDELLECNRPKLDTLQAEDLATWLLDNYEMFPKDEVEKPRVSEGLLDELAQVMSDSYARVTEVVKDKAMFRHYAKDLMAKYNITKK